MKIILAMAMALGVALGAGAAAPETVTLKNGSVYMGRTSIKNFEARSSSFMADSAIVVDSVKNVSVTMTVMPLASVKEGLANWFRQHPERISIGRDGAEEVVVHRLRSASSSVTDDVVLLERGPKVLKYVIIAPLTVEIPDSNVVSYEYAVREPQVISGIIDEVVTTDGRTLEGQIVHEGSLFGILTADNMVVEMLPYSKLSSTSKRALYADQPIIEQVPVLDEVRTKDGRTVSGIITSVNRRPHDGKPYYMLRPVNHGSEVKLYFDDVTSIYQPYNRDYKPLKDTRIDSDNTIIVAGRELLSTPYTMKQGSADLLFNLDKLPSRPPTAASSSRCATSPTTSRSWSCLSKCPNRARTASMRFHARPRAYSSIPSRVWQPSAPMATAILPTPWLPASTSYTATPTRRLTSST